MELYWNNDRINESATKDGLEAALDRQEIETSCWVELYRDEHDWVRVSLSPELGYFMEFEDGKGPGMWGTWKPYTREEITLVLLEFMSGAKAHAPGESETAGDDWFDDDCPLCQAMKLESAPRK
ncbi:MAG: hypothetical protein HY925_15165 [Elusimicrobia bacterium]|nr:hypothetical protein [Elusimicrobiota bacterium]